MDWQDAVAQFEREISDAVRGYRYCRDTACRRARRCVGCEPSCFGLPPPKSAAMLALEQKQIEDIYAAMQVARRDAVLRRPREGGDP